ncbi:MAG: methyltransferase domain-containing protein [Pseudomonadota bacterium]
MMDRSWLFHHEWLRNPLQVGAIAPSSASLGAAITRGLGPTASQVLELGPGTGVFTRAMIEQGVPATRITAIEASSAFASSLARMQPQIHVVRGDASRLCKLLPNQNRTVKTVICGLPLLSMGLPTVYRIIHDSFQLLSDDGEFRLFTYGPNCPVPGAILDRINLDAERSGVVPMNLPPAPVFTLTRRAIA